MLIYHRVLVAAKSGKTGLDCRLEISDREFSLSMIISETTLAAQRNVGPAAARPRCRFSGCGAAHCTAPTEGGLLLLHQFRLVGPAQVGLPRWPENQPFMPLGRHDFPSGKDWEWKILLTCILHIYMYL